MEKRAKEKAIFSKSVLERWMEKSGTQLHCEKCNRTYDINDGTAINGSSSSQLYPNQVIFDGQLIRTWN